MAYKFQLGDFAASGSILMEGKGTATDDMIARADLYVSGTGDFAGDIQIPQNKKIFLDNNMESYIHAGADDQVQLVADTKVGLDLDASSLTLGDGTNHTHVVEMKASAAAGYELKQSTNSYIKADTANAKIILGQTVTASAGASFTDLAIDDLRFNGTYLGHQDDTDLVELQAGLVKVLGDVSSSLGYQGAGYVGEKIGHTTDPDALLFENQLVQTQTNVDFNIQKAGGLQLQGASVTSTAAELNYVDVTTLGSSEASKALTADASGDVTLVGADYNIVFDKSASALELADNAKITFGTGDDLSISWDGTDLEFGTAANANINMGHADSTVTIGGNLVVSGDTTTVNTAQLSVEDALIEMARSNSGDAHDIGFIGKYNDGADKYAGFFRDANDSGKFHLFHETTVDLSGVTTINRSGAGYAKADLVVGALEATSIAGSVSKSIVSKTDTQLDNSGNGYQLASGDTLIAAEDLGADRIVILPAAPAIGDVIEIKLKGAPSGRVLRVEKGHDSQNVDGGDSIVLESDYAAVTLVASSAGNTCAWRVF